MQDWTAVLQTWLPDELIKSLLGLGVIAGGVLMGVRQFSAGKSRGSRVHSTAESDLRQGLSNISAENRRLHSETHKRMDEHDKRLEDLGTSVAVLLDRTQR